MILTGSIQFLRFDPDGVKEFDALVHAQPGRPHGNRPWNLFGITGIQPFGNRNRFQIEAGLILRDGVSDEEKEK